MRPLLCLLALTSCGDPFRGSPAYDDGSRVSVRFLQHAGGARAALGLFDEERGTRCTPRLHVDGSLRCLPGAVTLLPGLFSTNTCDAALATFVPAACPSIPAAALFQAGTEPDACGDIPTWAAFATTTPLPNLFGDPAQLGTCERVPTPEGQQAVGIGAEITADLFVEATLESLEVTEDVSAEVWSLVDGARFGVRLRRGQVRCTAEPFDDDTVRCVPSRGLREMSEVALYADAVCAEPALSAPPTCDGSPSHLVIRDEGRIATVRGLDGPEVTQAYVRRPDGCVPLPPALTPPDLVAAGAESPRGSFPVLPTVQLGDDVIASTWVTDGSGRAVAPAGPPMRLVGMPGAPGCTFGLDAIDQVWCVDDRLPRQERSTLLFVDSTCEQPVWRGLGDPPSGLMVVDRGATCPGTLFPVTWQAALVAGRQLTDGTSLHRLDGTGACVPAEQPVTPDQRAWALDPVALSDVGERLGLAVQY